MERADVGVTSSRKVGRMALGGTGSLGEAGGVDEYLYQQ